jgi:hypothetical protein
MNGKQWFSAEIPDAVALVAPGAKDSIEISLQNRSSLLSGDHVITPGDHTILTFNAICAIIYTGCMKMHPLFCIKKHPLILH